MKSFKDKIFNNSFTAYLRALYASPIAGKRETGFMVEMFVNVVSFVAVMFIVGNFESNIYWDESVEVVSTTAFAGAMLYGIWILLGITRRAKPSPLGLLPIGWKKRVVYDYLSNLVYTIFVVVIMVVAALVWMLILGLIILAATGYWIFVIEPSYGTVTTVTASAEGILFPLFVGLFIYGAGACLTNLPNKKMRIGLTIAFPFVLELLGLLFLNCAYDGDFVMSGNISLLFEYLPVSWLWLTFTAIGAVGITVLSVWLSIQANKPNKV